MEIVFLRQAYRFIKKSDPPLKEKIKEEISKIKTNPQIGFPLKGNLKTLRSHHFAFVNTQYRVAYKIFDDLIVVAIASRENFYRDLTDNIPTTSMKSLKGCLKGKKFIPFERGNDRPL